MINPLCEGPKEQWRSELDRVNRQGLIWLIERFVLAFRILGWGIPRLEILANVRTAKSIGKNIAALERCNRFDANPDKAVAERLRRRTAARRSARRGKKAAR